MVTKIAPKPRGASVPEAPPEHLSYWLSEWMLSRTDVQPVRARADSKRIDLYVAPLLGDRSVRRLGESKLSKWVETLRSREVGEATIYASLMCVRQALGLAVDRGVIDSNPAQGLHVRENAISGPEEGDIITEEDLQRLVAEIEPRFKALVLFSARTGARWEEVIALKPKDLLLDDELAVVGARKISDSGGKFAVVENDRKIRRTVPIPRDLVECLREHLELFVDPGQEFLFTTPRAGNHPTRSNFTVWVWRPALERAGLGSRSVTFHDLRHAAAVNFIRQGIPAEKVARYLGHTSDVTTRRFYKTFFVEQAKAEKDAKDKD